MTAPVPVPASVVTNPAVASLAAVPGDGFAGLLAALAALTPAGPPPPAAVAPAASEPAQAVAASAAAVTLQAGQADVTTLPKHATVARHGHAGTLAKAAPRAAGGDAGPDILPSPVGQPASALPALPHQHLTLQTTLDADPGAPDELQAPHLPVAAATTTSPGNAEALTLPPALTPARPPADQIVPATTPAAADGRGAATGPAPPSRSAAPAETVATASVTPGPVTRQIAPALVQLAHGPSGSAVTLRLDPAGLGHVQVRIDRSDAGVATIQVTAEHPETLRLLVADQPQLHRVLDDAGLNGDGRTLQFALATPGGQGAGGSGDGAAGGGQGGNRNGRTPYPVIGPDDETAFTLPPAWLRAGVDITA